MNNSDIMFDPSPWKQYTIYGHLVIMCSSYLKHSWRPGLDAPRCFPLGIPFQGLSGVHTLTFGGVLTGSYISVPDQRVIGYLRDQHKESI